MAELHPIRLAFSIGLVVCLLSGCALSAQPDSRIPKVTQQVIHSTTMALPAQTATTAPTATDYPTPTPTQALPYATPTAAFGMCSPLEGISLAEMGQPDLLKNPFQMPRPGMDDGHHGADFAYWSRGEHKTMLGLPVYSVLNGQVAAVIKNRQPYGNAIIIETPLIGLPQDWLNSVMVPTPAPTVPPTASLHCPPDTTDYAAHSGRSLYLLYAHFNKTPLVSTGQAVACGAPIGEVGTTGKSVNPHLHLETRVGPSGASFASLSYYDTAATDAEMSAYCTWRVSGLFQMFDPMQLLK